MHSQDTTMIGGNNNDYSYEAEDPYNTTKLNIRKTIMMAFDDEKTSSLGGFAETESQVYRTDAV